jgi:hypothetical protein
MITWSISLLYFSVSHCPLSNKTISKHTKTCKQNSIYTKRKASAPQQLKTNYCSPLKFKTSLINCKLQNSTLRFTALSKITWILAHWMIDITGLTHMSEMAQSWRCVHDPDRDVFSIFNECFSLHFSSFNVTQLSGIISYWAII